MDLDNFSQCLQYIQTAQPNLLAGKLLPAATGLFGTLLGFGLNYWTSTQKDKKIIDGKKICCEEDIEQLQKSISEVIKEICNLCATVARGGPITHHSVSISLSALYLNKHFGEIAHEYSSARRESAQLIINYVERLNKKLPEINPTQVTPALAYTYILVNLINVATISWYHCENFKTDKLLQPDEDDIIRGIKLTAAQFQAYKTIKKNIENNNALLNLPDEITPPTPN